MEHKDLIIKNLAKQYKETLFALELYKKNLDAVREEFLGEVESCPGEYFGIKVGVYNPSPTIDWKGVVRHFNITPQDLEPFTREKEEVVRITVERQVAI